MIHFGKRRIPVVLLILVFPVNCLLAQKTHSDNNDGTYTNPVIFANYDQTIPTLGTARLEVKNMKDGDVAGLAVFQDPYAFIAVKQNKGSKFLIMFNNGKAIDSLTINNSSVYLRTIASNKTKKATFEYSFDNNKFTPLGTELSMRFNLTIFTGNKFCLFNYVTYETGGHVDFDWFRMQLSIKNNYSTYHNLP